jgi:hypothetical protein
MRRAFLPVAVLSALWAAACSGGGSAPPPPPQVGQFSNASLNGLYAFSMSGVEVGTSGGLASNFFTRAGSFSANGAGGITTGVEDVNLVTGAQRIPFTGGSYSISADGRGTLSLINSTGTLQFSITLTGTNGGLIIATPPDGSSTASGSFIKQNAAAFAVTGIANDYAFDFSGVDPNSVPESIVGHVHADGAGSFVSGVADDNDGGFVTPPAGPVAINGTYGVDGAHTGDLASFGRAVAAIANINGVVYIIDQTRFLFIETGSGGALIGSAASQSGVPTSVAGISGGFAFLMAGSAGLGPFTRGGRFTTSGGSLSNILVDQNNNGSAASFPNPIGSATAGTYTIDSTGTGRGTATFTLPGAGNGAFTFVFYLISPTQGFLQDQSPNIVADGTLLGQPSTINAAMLAGNYAYNWSGVTIAGGILDEEDTVGQIHLANAGTFTGTMDLNEFGPGKQFLGFAVDGTLALNGDGTGHNTFTINLRTNPANTNITFFAYVGNNNTVLLLSTQSVRVAVGVLNPQP